MTDTDYEKEASEILKPFCKYCLPTDSRERIAAYLKSRDLRVAAEARREAFEEAAKGTEAFLVDDGAMMKFREAVVRWLMAKAAALPKPRAVESKEKL